MTARSLKRESYTHVLAEFDCLDPLLSALRLDSGRLKCTCIAISRKWLALGTSAGGLHLIQRDGWKQRLILTHKEGSITQAACCPHDEDFIAVATSEGLVVVWELQLERRGRPERACVSWEHRGMAITALCWDTATLRVFIGDTAGKVSCLRAGSSKLGKVGSAFVIFPVQTVTTVDSRVVQLGYLEGRLLVSSLSRCYLCDTEREKFWRVGNKERDGEYGACFCPQQQTGLRGLPGATGHLLYCARPGSRVWEANFNGEVLSTHQFKQLLACPASPLISGEPQYIPDQKHPQSLAFPRLLNFSDQNLLTWTDSAIYIFTPQSGQVLLWTEIKGIVDVAVFRSELFCLHGDGHLSHLSLLPAERCVERLIRRENWTLAATVCCMFQHAIALCRARKSIPIDRLEHLKTQLNSTSQQQLIVQLEEVISKLEPLDSACSSRRSSISSHESFSVLDCGIYRVISRRGSQSDEDTSSLVSQSMLEEERLKEFNFAQEEEQVEHDSQSYVRAEGDKSDLGLQFHLPLSFRPKPPRIALQAVKDSVSSFVKKTTEKINTLQMNSDLWTRPDHRESGQGEVIVSAGPVPDEVDNEVLGPEEHAVPQSDNEVGSLTDKDHSSSLMKGEALTERKLSSTPPPVELSPPLPAPVKLIHRPLPPELQEHLSQLACLYLDLGCPSGAGDGVESGVEDVCAFLQRYFFLLDQERVRRMCMLRYREQPEVLKAYIAGMLGESSYSFPLLILLLKKGDLLKSLRSLRELQPWNAPLLLSHLYRLYARHGEVAVRAYPQFYPTILPSDIMAMVQPSHFLPYLDNLVQSRAEEQRLSFLGSLLQPETLRQDWLELALTHDAPQREDTLTADGQPKWRSHYFCWGYGRLLSLLIRLPADFASKMKMLESCCLHGYWVGYLYLCNELQRRTEAFTAICKLDDMSLLEEPNGTVPQTVEEWMLLIRLCQEHHNISPSASSIGPGDLTNGSAEWSTQISVEKLILCLARAVGPDQALAALQEGGVQLELSPRSTLVCELLRVAEKRQRALIQTMLERCDRFLWSQQA
uniref:Hermansky-Pudlak syndrome 5 protein homolog n=1 Tax=Astyanax mexicanus TaxID=7994 RepID=A0A8B9RAT0_ASTMX